MQRFFFVFLVATICKARYFPNPILTNNHSPSVIKLNGMYFMVTRDEDFPYNIPIYSSKDLISWKFENFVFQTGTTPAWIAGQIGTRPAGIFSPEIQQINKDSFGVYFHATQRDASAVGYGLYAIGVATAATPTGPYVEIGKPVFQLETRHVQFPNIAFDGPSMYLIYNQGGDPSDDYWAVQLSEDGLKVTSNYSEICINNTEHSIYSNWHMKHENVDYIIFQDYIGSIRVARSVSGLFGPYESKKEPLIPGYFGQPCVVKDAENDEDVLIFEYSISPFLGDGVYASSLGWVDGWPVVKK